jgi:hypothetical protein
MPHPGLIGGCVSLHYFPFKQQRSKVACLLACLLACPLTFLASALPNLCNMESTTAEGSLATPKLLPECQWPQMSALVHYWKVLRSVVAAGAKDTENRPSQLYHRVFMPLTAV